MQYTPKTVSTQSVSSAESQMYRLFDDLRSKWLSGMDITSYTQEKFRHKNIMVSMDMFFDQPLINMGCALVNQGKTSVNEWVLWLCGAEFVEYPSSAAIFFRSEFFAERARSRFALAISEHLRKPVSFQFSQNLRERLNIRNY